MIMIQYKKIKGFHADKLVESFTDTFLFIEIILEGAVFLCCALIIATHTEEGY